MGLIFQYTWQQVMSGDKTQTSRIDKQYVIRYAVRNVKLVGPLGLAQLDWPERYIQRITSRQTGRTIWQVGNTYAVQPGRGQKAIGRIKITAIDRRDVRTFTHADALREGFDKQSPIWPKFDFLRLWTQMHDPQVAPSLLSMLTLDDYNHSPTCLKDRPANLYQAIVLSFELVCSAA